MNKHPHHHHHEHKKPKYDLLAHMRKPHGIAILVTVLGLAGWAIWTFWVW